jgi:hypothetical protein
MESIADGSGRAVGTGTNTSAIAASPISPGSHGSNNEFSAGFRFTGVTVPQAATITSATFTLRPFADYNAGANTIRYHVSGQAADNAAAFSTSGGDLNTTNRPRTTADAGPWTQTSILASTPESISVTAVVQEIVNRGGWVNGNALVILIDTHTDTTTSEWQDYVSYDGTPANAATLDITYTTGGGQPTRSIHQFTMRRQ